MLTVLVVREFDEFSRILSENDFSVTNCPTIRIIELDNLTDYGEKVATLAGYDGVFLTSINATKIFHRKLIEGKKNFNGKVYVFGKRSFNELKNSALDIIFDESASTASEMLNKIAPEQLKNKRFLFVRGDKSLNIVADFLKGKATLDETVVYKTEKRKVESDEIREVRSKIENKLICCACFFSPCAAESFIEQFGAKILHQTLIASIGETTAEFFEQRNLRIDFVSSKSNAETFAFELMEFMKNGKNQGR